MIQHRYGICSSDEKLNKEIAQLPMVFTEVNGYLLHLVDVTMKSVKAERRQPRNDEPNEKEENETKKLMMIMSYA